MLKKLAKIFPIAFFVLSLGLWIFVLQLKNRSQTILSNLADTNIHAQSCPGVGESCEGLTDTHCNTSSCCEHTCIDGVWGPGTYCGDVCASNPLCASRCSGDDGNNEGGACNKDLGYNNCDNLCSYSNASSIKGLCRCRLEKDNKCVYQMVNGKCKQTYTPGDEWFCDGGSCDGGGGTISYKCADGYFSDSACSQMSGSSGAEACVECNDCGGSEPPPSPTPYEMPDGKITAACDPPTQDYVSDLTQAAPIYKLKITDITHPENVKHGTFALCFNTSQTYQQQIKDFMGPPHWPLDPSATGPFCYNIAFPNQIVETNELHFRWTKDHTFANNSDITLNELAYQTQQWINEGVLPDNFKYSLYGNIRATNDKVNDQLDGIGFKIDLTPNACAEPPPAPQCNNIQMFPLADPPSSTPITDFSTLQAGQGVSFQCYATSSETNPMFKYRIIQVDAEDPSKGTIAGYSDVTSGRYNSFIIPSPGKYFAQCTVCESKTNCAEWEPIPNITVQDGGLRDIVCATNASEQECDSDDQCFKCYGSGAVCNDNHRCEIPTGAMPLD